MVAEINTITFSGIEVIDVSIQVHLSNGIPAFNIVGLPDKTIAEARERIRSALHSMGLNLPTKRITVNLAPADLLKEGSHFDLPIAVGLLCAMNILPLTEIAKYILLGELALDSRVMKVAGVLPSAIGATARNKGLICPQDNEKEATWSGNQDIIPTPSLLALINHFRGTQIISPAKYDNSEPIIQNFSVDMADIAGQEVAKRALEIAAAGRHNVLMYGSPGTGKSMLASRLPTILPPMDAEEMLECSMIASIAGSIEQGELTFLRPFRSPHHSCSMAAMVGGGRDRRVKPGEISLAHNGVLFLDELPEFPRAVLESLRQPLEDGKILISRSDAHITFPARFQLVAAMNPCRCGYLLDPARSCNKAPNCSQDYLGKISGPLLDRFDIYLEVPHYSPLELRNSKPAENSSSIAKRVTAARLVQAERYRHLSFRTNSELNGKLLNEFAPLTNDSIVLLDQAVEKWRLSVRGYNRMIRLARTIADLEGEVNITKYHIAEAINYRQVLGIMRPQKMYA